MDNSRFFLWINRLNSIVFLLLLLCGLGFTLINALDGLSSHRQEQSVAFTNDEKTQLENNPIDLHLGSSSQICGTDLSYIELQTQPRSSGSFSSGYNSDIKNILFTEMQTMKNWWLFDSNKQNIDQIIQLQHNENSTCSSEKTIALMFVISVPNSDKKSIALSATDGNDYRVVSSNIDRLIESNISHDGSYLITIEQSGSEVFFRKYLINKREKIAESPISSISKKL